MTIPEGVMLGSALLVSVNCVKMVHDHRKAIQRIKKFDLAA